jgi:hypothetical protein
VFSAAGLESAIWAQMMLLAAPLLAVAVALAASGSQMELHLLANDIAQQHDAARGDHLRLTSGGHRKTQGGQPRIVLGKQNRPRGAILGYSGHCRAKVNHRESDLEPCMALADPRCRAAPTRAGRPEEARGVRRLRGLASVPSRCLAARAIPSASRAASAA